MQQTRIRNLAAQLDAHRKRQQAQHPALTLTGMYNVLEKLKDGAALNAKDKVIHEQGLVAVLKQYHDELDLAVLDAYGWNDLASLMNAVNGIAPGGGVVPASRDEAKRVLDDALLERLVALNAERAAEEAKGQVRWLRPEFQIQGTTRPASIQGTLDVVEGGDTSAATGTVSRLPWPKELPERIRLVAQVLTDANVPLSEEQIAERFSGKGPWKKGLAPLIETLVALGRARRVKGGVLGVD